MYFNFKMLELLRMFYSFSSTLKLVNRYKIEEDIVKGTVMLCYISKYSQNILQFIDESYKYLHLLNHDSVAFYFCICGR